MRVTMRLFGRLRDLAGASVLDREMPAPATASGVWEAVAAEFPGHRPVRASRCRSRSTRTSRRSRRRWRRRRGGLPAAGVGGIAGTPSQRRAASQQQTGVIQGSDARQADVRRIEVHRSARAAQRRDGAGGSVPVPHPREGAGRDRARRREVPRVQGRRVRDHADRGARRRATTRRCRSWRRRNCAG